MSENQSPKNSSASEPNSEPNGHLGNMEGVSQLLSENDPQQTILPLEDEPLDMWEAVDAADSVGASVVGDGVVAEATEGPVGADLTTNLTIDKAVNKTISRETELLALIHDLNACNDTLLARVSGLENELNTAHSALKAEAEKARTAEDRMHRQVSAEHASAQQLSQTAQQQIGKLVSQLEVAQRSLSREQLISENLQTELNNAQDRISQLERESALIAQQYSEQSQALSKAEATSRDLRSRLQRQQRYTLQFKAALEKSLSVSARAASTQLSGQLSGQIIGQSAANLTTQSIHPISYQDPATLAMPKAQRIMPWASASSASSFQGIDPHLETLIRNAGKPNRPVASQPAEPTATASPTISPEAEAKLWQDLERVMHTDAQIKPEPETLQVQTAQPEEKAAADIPAAKRVSSSPVLNWQTKRMQETESAIPESAIPESAIIEPPAISAEKVTAETQEEVQGEVQAESVADLAASFAAAANRQSDRQSDSAAAFTEPSPWGKPLPKAPSEQGSSQPATASAVTGQDYLPALEPISTVSPLVNPLRAQKKRGSLASVQLPTFPNAKVGSFRR